MDRVECWRSFLDEEVAPGLTRGELIKRGAGGRRCDLRRLGALRRGRGVRAGRRRGR